MPLQYTTVYQISQLAPDWPFACIGLIPLTAGIVIIWGKRRFKWTKPHWLFAAFCCFFGVLWSGIVGPSILSADWRVFTAYQNGDYRTVEGVVYDFHPMPYEGHQDECFSVQHQRFCYSDFEIAPGFHNATSHGGPIRSVYPSELPTAMDVSSGSIFPRIRFSPQHNQRLLRRKVSGNGNGDQTMILCCKG